jgi:hypothetical protein
MWLWNGIWETGESHTEATVSVNGNDEVSDKISKFFVSHVEESITGHLGIMEFIKS